MLHNPAERLDVTDFNDGPSVTLQHICSPPSRVLLMTSRRTEILILCPDRKWKPDEWFLISLRYCAHISRHSVFAYRMNSRSRRIWRISGNIYLAHFVWIENVTNKADTLVQLWAYWQSEVCNCCSAGKRTMWHLILLPNTHTHTHYTWGNMEYVLHIIHRSHDVKQNSSWPSNRFPGLKSASCTVLKKSVFNKNESNIQQGMTQKCFIYQGGGMHLPKSQHKMSDMSLSLHKKRIFFGCFNDKYSSGNKIRRLLFGEHVWVCVLL